MRVEVVSKNKGVKENGARAQVARKYYLSHPIIKL
jgi:hypothetical protein